jgi:hypothetical protein
MNCQDRLGTNVASTISRYKETDKCCVLWYADVHCSVGWIRAATGAIPTIPPTASAATAPAAAAVTPHSIPLPSQKSWTTSPRAEKHPPLFHFFPPFFHLFALFSPFFSFFTFFFSLKKTNDLSSEITTITQFAKTGLEQTRKMVLNKEAPPARFARETAALRSSCCSFTTSLGHTS